MQAYGLPSCALLLLCWASEQSVRVLTQWWLSQWTASEGRRQFSQELGDVPCTHVPTPQKFQPVCALRSDEDVNHRSDSVSVSGLVCRRSQL